MKRHNLLAKRAETRADRLSSRAAKRAMDCADSPWPIDRHHVRRVIRGWDRQSRFAHSPRGRRQGAYR